MFETKSGILLIAGIGFFALAFLSNGAVPILMYADRKEKTAAEMVNHNVLVQFENLAERYPEAFAKHFGALPPLPQDKDAAAARDEKMQSREAFLRAQCAEAILLGRDVYVGEGCWHCHSQFIRPVSNESRRWGPVAQNWEYENELQRPVLFGTRRVGPDLSRAGGRHGNDWHLVHFFKPRLTSPQSVMPDYPWFFEESETIETTDERGRTIRVPGPTLPNKRGLAITTYMQWLGSWLDSYPTYHLDSERSDTGAAR
jgi:cytochrome c oxidase cbb3-type subunit 2